jgi:hypothetical protein
MVETAQMTVFVFFLSFLTNLCFIVLFCFDNVDALVNYEWVQMRMKRAQTTVYVIWAIGIFSFT